MGAASLFRGMGRFDFLFSNRRQRSPLSARRVACRPYRSAPRRSPREWPHAWANRRASSRVEALRGYLNLYYDTGDFARQVVDAALQAGPDFGRGPAQTERVMVEYAQPNTHHSFHIGHYRNTILGEALSRIVQFAGFETIRASYPGDIGLGVITVMWIYQKFYQGQEPEGIHARGQWLLKLYIEATNLLDSQSR